LSDWVARLGWHSLFLSSVSKCGVEVPLPANAAARHCDPLSEGYMARNCYQPSPATKKFREGRAGDDAKSARPLRRRRIGGHTTAVPLCRPEKIGGRGLTTGNRAPPASPTRQVADNVDL
jgi:hypothetical protein